MKNIIKTVMYLQITALFLLTAFADPSVKEKDLRGSIQSFETTEIDLDTMTLFVDGSGTGHATHLGQFTYTYHLMGDLNTACGGGPAEFTAANGDRLFTESTGCGGPPTDAGFRVVEEHTILGGTGRFAGASGSFTLERLLTAIGNTNLSVGTIDGTLVTAKTN